MLALWRLYWEPGSLGGRVLWAGPGPVPFHGPRVHLLLVVQQPVGGAGDGDGRVQAQGLRRGQQQLALQLELIVLQRRGGTHSGRDRTNTL